MISSVSEHGIDEDNGFPWINPIGGLGDTLMVSGVLKQVSIQQPAKYFNLVRRTRYLSILSGHPAIKKVGCPAMGSRIIGTDYWCHDAFKLKDGPHAFEILGEIFGLDGKLEPPSLYLPGGIETDPLLQDSIPWGKRNILIAPASDSPRKEMQPHQWHHLVEKLVDKGCFVLQAGRHHDLHIRNAYSVLGLTTPRQAISLLSRCDLLISPDNFFMHAAHLIGMPAVILWGPTYEHLYGYPGQKHVRAEPLCNDVEKCIGPKLKTYPTSCPKEKVEHCMNRIDLNTVFDAAMSCLA